MPARARARLAHDEADVLGGPELAGDVNHVRDVLRARVFPRVGDVSAHYSSSSSSSSLSSNAVVVGVSLGAVPVGPLKTAAREFQSRERAPLPREKNYEGLPCVLCIHTRAARPCEDGVREVRRDERQALVARAAARLACAAAEGLSLPS